MLTRQITFILMVEVAAFFSFVPAALAQSDTPKLEVGAQFSVIHINDFGRRRTEPGLGGRFTYNATANIALESEFNFFPRSHANEGGFGRKVEGLFGTKIGLRRQRFGVFGKAKPGFFHYSRVPPVACIRAPCFIDRTNFAIDIGGVVETYPSRHSVVRFDIGDTIIRSSIVGGTRTTHNSQFNAGVGYRF